MVREDRIQEAMRAVQFNLKEAEGASPDTIEKIILNTLNALEAGWKIDLAEKLELISTLYSQS